MDLLHRSWGSMTADRAAAYLKTYGAPAESSKRLLLEVLRESSTRKCPSVLDLGCGNAQLLEYFCAEGYECNYTGVDISTPLLDAARAASPPSAEAQFVAGDVNSGEGISGHFDFAVYSHVLEMLSSPEGSLQAAKELADKIVIRFFEPPDGDVDIAEVRNMEVGDGTLVPYLRRSMSRDYYRLILSKLECTRVDVYLDDSTDQVHVLHFER